MANQNGQGDEKKGGKGVLIAGAVVIVGLVAVIAVMGSLLLNRPEPVAPQEEEPPQQRSMLVTEDNLDEVISELETPPANVPQYFTANMNSTWNFPDGRTSVDAYVGNYMDNETPLYFDVSLTDTGETVFESPVIPLGGQLNGITLNRTLDDGTYSADLVYHLIDENQRTLTTVTMAVTLVVGLG
jgi:hypothetical protein